MKEENETLQATIKQLQQTAPLFEASKKSVLVGEAWSEFSIKESSKYEPTPYEPDPMAIDEDCERIELLPPSSSSIPSPPTPPASVDDLLAFLVWLFLHIAVFIDSHRKVYQPV